MTPETWRVLRDVVIVAVASMILLHQTFVADQPNVSLLTVAAGLLAVPAWLRMNGHDGGGK